MAFAFSPVADDGRPLHRRIAGAVRGAITAQPDALDQLLPDEISLAAQFGVSRGTMRQALATLVDEGLLERSPGIGTRIVDPPAESAIGAWRSFSTEMARRGVAVTMFACALTEERAPAGVAAALRLGDDARVQRLDRVRGWDGVPVLRSRSWFHPDVRLPDDGDFARPLYDLVAEASGRVADRAREAFTAVVADAALARDLALRKGAPLLLRRHTVADAAGHAFEHAEVHYASERFALTLDLRREPA